MQEKKDLQTELHSYMNRLSELQIHKENLEANLTNQLKNAEEKLISNALLIQQKDTQIDELKVKLSELNDDMQTRNDYDHDEMLSQSYENEITRLKTEVDNLRASNATLLESNDTKNEGTINTSSLNNAISQKLLETKNEEIDELHSQIFKLQQEESEKISQLEQAIKKLEQQAQDDVERLDSQLDEKKSLILSLERKFEDLQSQKNALIVDLEGKIRNKHEENDKLSSDLAQLNELNVEYKDLLDQYDLRMEELGKENDNLKLEKARLGEHVDVKEKIIENLNAEINEMNAIQLELNQQSSQLDFDKVASASSSEEKVRIKIHIWRIFTPLSQYYIKDMTIIQILF